MASVSAFIRELDQVSKGKLSLLHRNFLRSFITAHKDLFARLSLDTSMAEEKSPGRFRILDVQAAIFYHQSLYNALMTYLPEQARQVYNSVIWDGRQRVEELEKRFGVKIRSEKEEFSDSQEALQPEYLMLGLYFRQQYDFYQGKYLYSDFELGLPSIIRQHLKKIASPPAEALFQSLYELPPQDFVYESNESLFDEFLALRAYFEQLGGESISASIITKARKYFSIQEFYPESAKPLHQLRSRLLLQFLESTYHAKEKRIEAHQHIRVLFKAYAQGRYSNLSRLLFHLKGSKTYVDENTTVNTTLLETLSELPLMQWISVSNLVSHIRYIKPELLPIREYMARNMLHIDAVNKYGKEPVKIREDLYVPVITEPLIKASFFLYAALGLVDITYSLPVNEKAKKLGTDYFSVFDGLQYIRLTMLGAFVCDVYPTYQPQESKRKKAKFIADDNRLVITLSEEDKLKSLLLEKYATPLSGNRFRVEYESFLKECENKKQVIRKIEAFRSEIISRPPQVWEDFFSEIVHKFGRIQQKNDFRIYKLPATDKELHALIARDEVLRTIVYKAENFHVMVSEPDIPLFKSRLKKAGYVWEE